MSPNPAPLPEGWTINLHRAHNLTVLTLIDAGGTARDVGFRPLTSQEPQDNCVSALDQIPEPELREAAHNLLASFYARTAQAQRNSDTFGKAFPDLSALFARLDRQVPGCEIDMGIDSEALTLRLTVAAPRAFAGELLALVSRWPGSTADGCRADGVDRDLAESGELTLTLRQDLAEQFLAWYRDQP